MKIKFYGSRGWITSNDDHSCFSVYEKNTKILFDAGSPKILTPQNVNLDAIILSHTHFDHIKNIYNLIAYMNTHGRRKHLKIYAPVNLKGLISTEIIPEADHFRNFTYEFITKIPKKIGVFKINHITSRQNTKPFVKVFSIKIDDGYKKLTYVTDVSLSQSIIKFCQGTDILVCDAAALDDNNCGHMSPISVKKLVSLVAPKKLILTHFDQLTPTLFLKQVDYEGAICAKTNLIMNITH
jgi:ribonuclease BN (tRNA processing enzyme)